MGNKKMISRLHATEYGGNEMVQIGICQKTPCRRPAPVDKSSEKFYL